MQYLMAPLEQHYDDGFGMVAEAFRDAAATLLNQGRRMPLCEHLPQNFLLRHAVELYLKSGIIIVHRRLKIPYGDQPSTAQAAAPSGDKWKPLYKIHSIATLYEHWKDLIKSNAETLHGLCKYNAAWDVPAELDTCITTIEQTDPGGTYYRYPVTRDAEADKNKSLFKETPVDALFSTDMPEGKRVRALVLENDKREFVRAFALDDATEKEATASLLSAVKVLSEFHAMMRIEITAGW